MNLKEHWNRTYQTKGATEVSWFQERPDTSLRLIEATAFGNDQGVIDVGGGASVLVDHLLDAGFKQLAVLDISVAALTQARQRLGARTGKVEWFEADVTEFNPPHQFAVWHDRAVFDFLTQAEDRRKYVQTLKRTIAPGGSVIIATFALDGPPKCSGLDVARYAAAGLGAELGVEFQLREELDDTHVTPWKTEQKFSYFRFTRTPAAEP